MNRLRGIALAALSAAAFTGTGSAWAQTYVDVTPGAAGVIASTNDGNVPANAVDGSLTTRWSANGDGQWLELDLGGVHNLARVTIGTYNGNSRRGKFDLLVLSGGTWKTAIAGGMTSGTTTAEETFDFPIVPGNRVRYVDHGNTSTTKPTWNSVTEISVFAVP